MRPQTAPAFVRWSLFGVLLLALAAAGTTTPTARADLGVSRFDSRPDLRPPVVRVTTAAEGTKPGLLMLNPAATLVGVPAARVQTGPLIVDDTGSPVWFAPMGDARVGDLTGQSADLKVQRYRGRDVLTYWRGDILVPPGAGNGEFVILDETYAEIAVVRPGEGLTGDLHEFVLTPEGTALILAYDTVPDPGVADNDGDRGPVVDNVVQEIDVATGRVLFTWRALDHVPVSDTVVGRDVPGGPLDYLHANSIALAPDGDLIVSARHTNAVYKIDRRTGAREWTLGGRSGDFELGPGVEFFLQHDARPLPGGRLSIFDNGPAELGADGQGTVSRAIVLRLDERARTADLVREEPNPQGLYSASQGSAQVLAGGNILAGWGSQPWLTEYDRAGAVVFEATLGRGLNSYRAFRAPWVGRPTEPIAVRAVPAPGQSVVVRASWNGATEVATWRVLTGPVPEDLRPAVDGARTGFETVLRVPGSPRLVAVEALDSAGRVLGTSTPVRVVG